MINYKLLFMFVGLVLMAVIPFPGNDREPEIHVASKKFTESVILGEMLQQLSQESGTETQHMAELGGTQIVFNALEAGQLDVYIDYTGTIQKEILSEEKLTDDGEMRNLLARRGIAMSKPIGFNNSYAVGMLESRARELGIESISDLKQHPQLKFRFSNEFMERADGWRGMRSAYGLMQEDVQGLDHDIAYLHVEAGSIDVIDVYTTDAKIEKLNLRVLKDDRKYFPTYDAVVLYRETALGKHPKAIQAMLSLVGQIDEPTMTKLNNQVESGRLSEARVANTFLNEHFSKGFPIRERTIVGKVWAYSLQHLNLVRRSLIPAILIAIPLGVVAAKNRFIGQIILGLTAGIQTIPSLALLAFLLIPMLALNLPAIGVDSLTAVLALGLYSLLPIVRNTYTGFHSIPTEYTEASLALGMTPRERLNKVELPLASRSILSGIKTAAVLNVGFATLGALIGAGGYGQPILSGIRLGNYKLILMGVIPAVLMALAFQGLFEIVERVIVPKGLRLQRR